MRLIVHRAQARDRDMRVQLRGGQRRVAEQFLHDAQVGTALKQVGGGAVPELVQVQAGVVLDQGAGAVVSGPVLPNVSSAANWNIVPGQRRVRESPGLGYATDRVVKANDLTWGNVLPGAWEHVRELRAGLAGAGEADLVVLVGWAGVVSAQGLGAEHLVWSDEFNGSSSVPDPANWKFETGGRGWGNHELETYCAPGSGCWTA